MDSMVQRSTTEHVQASDQRVAMYGLTWADFESFLALRGDRGPRVAYLRGTLELMSPSRDHETVKMKLAAIVQAYLEHLDIPYVPVGAWLLKRTADQVGVEPDDSYVLDDPKKDRPDLAIEIIWTSGGVDKLAIYARIGVPEIWFWESGALTFFVLDNGQYTQCEQSVCVPGFDKQLAYELLEVTFAGDIRRILRARLD